MSVDVSSVKQQLSVEGANRRYEKDNGYQCPHSKHVKI